MTRKNKIKIAIAGIGNASCAFLQSLVKYANNESQENQKLTYNQIAGYSINDIEAVQAFDINKTKVNISLDKAMFAEPNVTPQYVSSKELEMFKDVTVKKGSLLDGINKTVSSIITVDDSKEVDVAKELKDAGTDILIVLIPSGADEAVNRYAEAALEAGCAFINGTPTQIASDPKWAQKYKKAGLPLVGDDLQSQVGGTRLHKGILELLNNLGADVVHTYQLDVSGGAEGLTTLDSDHRLRLMKSEIKTESIKRAIPNLSKENIASGTTDYLDFLGNQRIGHFWIRAKDFLGGQIHVDMTVKSFDGPNAAGVLVDVIRATKLAMNRAIEGPAISISAYGFKNPPVYIQESEATIWFREFIDAKRLT